MCRTINEAKARPDVGCTELFCPSCGQLADQDHNAFWCNRCRRLWPKGVGADQTEIKDGVWEMEGREKRESIIRQNASNRALTR